MTAALCCCLILPAAAQGQLPNIPVDSNVRIGKLENGLTYYLRHNALPEKRAEFYIAQKVGSILEEPHQRGLAHFLEHMAFNGTKNFPGNDKGLGIIPWCETKGIKFGRDLNAYTSVDQTVYNISNVPVESETVVDSCLLILHDWSCALLLEEAEIDKERGVIHEEWRSRNSGVQRLITAAQPVLFADSKYADCMPIGTLDVIDNFPYDAIRDYYHKWYRPDLQGIIIVGDIDVDQVEAKLKSVFADVKKPQNPAERIYYPCPDNKEPLIYIGKDKEVDTPSSSFFYKQPAFPDAGKNNMTYLVNDYLISLANTMLNSRFYEIRQKANPPFLNASVSYGNFFLTKSKEALSIEGGSKAEGIEEAMKSILSEVERVRRFGFTESEYERARANFLEGLESIYNERNKRKHGSFVSQCVDHFLDNEPMPDMEFTYNAMGQIAKQIPVTAINQRIQMILNQEENIAVFVAATDDGKNPCPTKEQIEALLKGMRSLDVKPYEDKVKNEPLMSEIPQGGSIVSEKPDYIYGATELVLSNGVKVYLKKTDFKADQIIMSASSWGGTSLYDDNEMLNAAQLSSTLSIGGMGNHSKIELGKLLAGKRASVSPSVGGLTEGVSGSCAPKDFETMMQLTYLTFTAPRKDDEGFASYKSRLKAQLEGVANNPMIALNDTMSSVLYNNHPRIINMKAHMVEQLNYDRILEMYRERFADADDFTFFFVGNIDMDQVKPLIARYIGALPSVKGSENFVNRHVDIVKGKVTKEFAKEQQTPMATNVMVINGKGKYDNKNVCIASFFSQIMNMVFTEEIREKEGGTYGVSCSVKLEKYPTPRVLMQIYYQTDPTKKDHLNKRIYELLDEFAAKGTTEVYLNKVKEYMLKQYQDNQKENSYWMGNLSSYVLYGIDNTGYEAIINSITCKDVQKFAADLLKQGNQATVIMTVPEESK